MPNALTALGWFPRQPAFRRLLIIPAVTLVTGFGLATPAAAHAHVQPVAASYTDMSAGRGTAIIAALLGLFGMAVATLTFLRARRGHHSDPGRRGGVVAMSAGAIGTVLGVVVIATADGGLGTGNGLGGAFVAVLVSVLSLGLGCVVLARNRLAS